MRRKPEIDDVLLNPGRHFVGGGNCRMRTVLGPGIVITLWNRARRMGAMSHFLLAIRDGQPLLELEGRYGEDTLQLVLQGLQWARVELADCVARIFGNGNMLARTDRVPSLNSGQMIGDHARQLLRAHRIPIVSERFDIHGCHEITFDVTTGRAHIRRIKPAVVATSAPAQSIVSSNEPFGPEEAVNFGR